MQDFLRGQKGSISKLCGGLELDVELYHKAPMEIDVTCFGLDGGGRLSDDRYFVFYNHKESPEGAITLSGGAATGTVRFHLDLTRLPPQIDRLAFTAAIDGTRTMRELAKGYVRLLKGPTEVMRYTYGGGEFMGERALVVCEIYRKNGDWRISAVGRGFNGGLKALIESFGGIVAAPAPAATGVPTSGAPRTSVPVNRPTSPRAAPRRPTGAATPVSDIVSALPANVCTRMENLARQCRGDTEYLASLYKNMFSALAQFPTTAAQSVKVVLCADASGSMYDMYRNGRIQRVVDKVFAFATTFADTCSMDLWAFGAKCRQFGAVTMDNVRDYTFAESGGFDRWMSMLNYQYNNEPEAMRDLMMIYGSLKMPVMVLFLTDGRINSDWQIEEILIKASRFPLFWQFVGIHGEEYGVLEHLDEIDGRHTHNAGFLKMDDIDDLTDSALYSQLLVELDAWLGEVDSKKMLET